MEWENTGTGWLICAQYLCASELMIDLLDERYTVSEITEEYDTSVKISVVQ